MTILDDFLSRDAHRVWSASCYVRKLRDEQELYELARYLNEIHKATEDVELGGGFLENRYHLDFALKKLTAVRDSAVCLCELYPHNYFFNPIDEEDQGYVVITIRVADAVNWAVNYQCVCKNCGNKFSVKQGEYHYTWYRWRKINFLRNI